MTKLERYKEKLKQAREELIIIDADLKKRRILVKKEFGISTVKEAKLLLKEKIKELEENREKQEEITSFIDEAFSEYYED